MADFFAVALGFVLALMGALAVINHPLVDTFNRFVKSMGTEQTARDIEMSGVSVMIGRIVGIFTVLFGIGIALNGF